MKRKCDDCEHYAIGEHVLYGYCKADREMRIESECDDYNPKRMDVIVIGKATFERVKYELARTTKLVKETQKSFVTEMGNSYLLCGSVEDLRGRRAKEVIVGRGIPLAEYIDIIVGIIEHDFTRLSSSKM